MNILFLLTFPMIFSRPYGQDYVTTSKIQDQILGQIGFLKNVTECHLHLVLILKVAPIYKLVFYCRTETLIPFVVYTRLALDW